MKTKNAVVTLVASASIGLATYATPHHSFVSQFDPEKLRTFSGKVEQVRWVNPHAFFDVSFTNEAGETEIWSFELGSPNTLIRYGWYRDTLQIGDQISVEGYLARNGTNLANAKTVTLADGTLIQAASSYLQDTR